MRVSKSSSDSCSIIIDEPGSATITASSVSTAIELISICGALCITISGILDGSTASEKFSKSEPLLRSNTSEFNIGCIMSDSDEAASIAFVVGITITELFPVSVIAPARRAKYTLSVLETKILCILMPLRSASVSEITMTLFTLPLDDRPPVKIY